MRHRQVVVVVDLLDGDSERFKAKDGNAIVSGQELEELLLVVVAEVMEDWPEVDNGLMLAAVTLLRGNEYNDD